MSTRARAPTRAATRPPNPVEDELVGSEEGNVVEVPGTAELGAGPRGAGTPQITLDIDVMAEDSEVMSEIIDGDEKRGAKRDDTTQNGDVDTTGGDLEVGVKHETHMN